jgi:hypothetical protein
MGWHMASMPRHHEAMMQGIPAPCAAMTDPLAHDIWAVDTYIEAGLPAGGGHPAR